MGRLPIHLGIWGGRTQRAEGATRNEFIDWWAPHLNDRDLLRYSILGMEEEIPRCPSDADTDDYLATPTEEQSVETDSSDGSDGWMQLLMPQDWYAYVADPEQNLPADWDMDTSVEASDDRNVG